MNFPLNSPFNHVTLELRSHFLFIVLTLNRLDIIDNKQTVNIIKYEAWPYSEKHGTIKKILIDPSY